jgi:hypothetical protein
MWMRLRQIALVAEELAVAESELTEVLGLEVCYRDPGVEVFGLNNILLPVGNQLLEVVAPFKEETAGGRYLERRGGDGGYMVITQVDDHGPRVARVKELGIRTVSYRDGEDYGLMQLHPKDTGGSFFEIDEQRGEKAHDLDGPWHPAGPNWQRAKQLGRVSGISAAEIQCDDPDSVASRWSEIAQIPLTNNTLQLDNATLRFVECLDGRPEGLGAIDVICTNVDAVLSSAKKLDAQSAENQVMLCGIRINLVGE